jgi:hypothetical protein
VIPLPRTVREQARRAYLAGERVTKIAQDFSLKRSTVSQWARRGRWAEEQKAIVTRTNEAICKTAEAVTVCHYLAHQKRIQRVAEAKLEALEQVHHKKAADYLFAARALKQLDDVMRRNLGLDDTDSSSRGTINLHLGTVDPKEVIAATPDHRSATLSR